jgi:hypothetical protein
MLGVKRLGVFGVPEEPLGAQDLEIGGFDGLEYVWGWC